MFDLPQAKRVRREELFGDSDAASPAPSDEDGNTEALRAQMNARIAQSLGLDMDHIQSEGQDPVEEQKDEAEDDAFEFRLFNTSGSVPKIVLKDPLEPQGEGGFVKGRSKSSYIVEDVPESTKMQYKVTAMSGQDVLDRSRQRFWGLEMPWKVETITMTKKSKGPDTSKHENDSTGGSHRKRPGKKRRIILRTRERAKKEKLESAAKKEIEKEEHMKDKKKRLNRLKKLRRRAKDKEKRKAATGEGDGGEVGESSDDSV